MPDENLPGDIAPLDAIATIFDQIGEGDTPPATVVEAAPAASAASTAIPATVAPTSTVQLPVAAATTATPTVQTPAPVVSPQDAHMQTLLEQNRQLVQGVSEQTAQNRTLMEKLLKDNAPQLTAEQREAKIAETFKRLNTDPEALIAEITDTRARAIAEQMIAANRDPIAEQSRQTGNQLAKLLASPDGTIIRPELQDPEFFKEMVSLENQTAVMKQFYPGQAVTALAKNDGYFVDLYNATRYSRAVKAAANPTPSQTALDAQRTILAGSAPPAAGAGRTPGPEVKADETKAFKDSLVNFKGGFSGATSAAAWSPRR